MLEEGDFTWQNTKCANYKLNGKMNLSPALRMMRSDEEFFGGKNLGYLKPIVKQRRAMPMFGVVDNCLLSNRLAAPKMFATTRRLLLG